MVNSHERSGTHFLMNTIADNFGYSSDPFTDFDMPINPWIPRNITAMLKELIQNRPEAVNNIVKSHYEGKFFKPVMKELLTNIHMFYIYRSNPNELFKSLRKHFLNIPWSEGPKCKTSGALTLTEPYGGCMRYQFKQYPSMFFRWLNHKKSWMEDMKEHQRNIVYVKYEDLRDNFDETVKCISGRIGIPILGGVPHKPDKGRSIQNGEYKKAVMA